MRSADYRDVRDRFIAWAGEYDMAWLGCGSEAFTAIGPALPASLPTVANLDDVEDRKIASRLAAGALPCHDADRSSAHAARAVVDRLVSGVEIRRWRALHVRMASELDRVVVCSEVDRRALTDVGVSNAVVLPNVYPTPQFAAGRQDVGEPPTLSLIGTLHYPPNADAARFMAYCVLPEVRRQLPGARLRLVGRVGPEVADLSGVPGVVTTGMVADLGAELAKADIAVVPVRFGSGTRIKILEAFAHRIPVVSTHLGAEGLDVTHGRELLLADDPIEFAAACVEALTDPALRRRLVAAGHDRWLRDHQVEVLRRGVVRIARELSPGTVSPAAVTD
jgi:glycosyltransferase involved in cell wall biosynthesis